MDRTTRTKDQYGNRGLDQHYDRIKQTYKEYSTPKQQNAQSSQVHMEYSPQQVIC